MAEYVPLKQQEFARDERMGGFYDWLINEMPTLNAEILAGREEMGPLITAIQEQMRSIPPASELQRTTAREAIQYLGFAVSSAERHSQDKKRPAGEAMKDIAPDIDNTLLQLSEVAEHPPRDTVFTFALWNDPDKQITFTGDKQEALFIEIVRETFFQVDEAANLLRDAIADDKPLADEVNLSRLDAATAQIEAARQQFLRYMAKDSNGITGLTPDFFLNVFRQYNCSFPVDGEDWGAPTAANSTPHWLIDLMLKPVDVGYQNHVMSRLRYLTKEDKERVMTVLAEPGLFEKLASEIGTDLHTLMQLEDNSFDQLVASKSPELRKAIDGTSKFLEKYAQLSATHWTLITFFITKPLKVMTNVATTVSPERGTSGLTLDEVQLIRDMRFENPFLVKAKNLAAAQRGHGHGQSHGH